MPGSFRMQPRPSSLEEVIEVVHRMQEFLVRSGGGKGDEGAPETIVAPDAAEPEAPVGKTTLLVPPPAQRGKHRPPPAHNMVVIKGSDVLPTDQLLLKTPHTGTQSADTLLLVSDGQRMAEVARTHRHLETIFTQTETVSADFGSPGVKSMFGVGVGDLTLPPNLLVPGRMVRLTLRGIIRNFVTGDIRIKTLLGATTIGDTGATAMVQGSGGGVFEVKSLITCRTAGAAGTVIEVGWFEITSTGFGMLAVPLEVFPVATVVIDTTIALLVDATVELSTPGVNDAIHVTEALVEVLN